MLDKIVSNHNAWAGFFGVFWKQIKQDNSFDYYKHYITNITVFMWHQKVAITSQTILYIICYLENRASGYQKTDIETKFI